MKASQQQHVVVLGGGPCGLYAARRLSNHGFAVTVIDKGVRPGGLATAHYCGNNWYDMGVHMFHAFDKEIFEDIKQIMGEERIEVDLNAKIRWLGKSYRYPLQFQDMIKGIPFVKLCHQVFTLFGTQFKYNVFPKKPDNAEDALIQLYGKPLYKFFFEGFTHRYWDLHPKQLSATFITTKMPKLTAVEVLKKGLAKVGIKQRVQSVDSALSKETLHYSRTGAETMTRRLANAITDTGGKILLNAEVKKIVTDENNNVTHIHYEQDGKLQELACQECISTIPVNTLVSALTPHCPENIMTAASKLRYKPLVVYGLLVKKQRCLDSLYVYYRDRIFHRVGEPKNAGLLVEPPDHTVLIVELTCEIDDAKWRGDPQLQQEIFADLAAEGICEASDIVEIHINRSETGYPIFDLGFEPHLEAIKQYVNSFANLQTTGRQGYFTYPNMHTAMRMGWNAADKIIIKSQQAQTNAAEFFS